jgi:formylmethanofuran dehydrogenase subunit D
MESLKIVSFGTSKIQKSRRVALDPNLMTTLGMREGDMVRVDLDVQSATILIKREAGTQNTTTATLRRRRHV